MHGLGSWLLRNGHEPTIVASHDVAESYEIDGLPYRTVAARDMRRIYHELRAPVTMIPAMARLLRRLQPDVVHAYSYHDAIAAKLARLPYVISYAGIILPASWVKGRSRLQRKMFDVASKGQMIFCPSVACGEALKRDYGFDYELIPYGIDTASFAPTVETIPGRIVCAATPDDARKRPEFLVSAFARVAERNPDARLVFAAAASDATQQKLRALVPAAVQDRVEFLGDVPRDELSREFARASVSALTSLNEAFGLVQLESFAAGTPVVGTRSGAVPELVDDSVGALFEPDDVAGCAAALERVLHESGPEMQRRCITHAKQWDWDNVAPQTVAFYERRVAKGRR